MAFDPALHLIYQFLSSERWRNLIHSTLLFLFNYLNYFESTPPTSTIVHVVRTSRSPPLSIGSKFVETKKKKKNRERKNFKIRRRSWSFCKMLARNWPGPNCRRRRNHGARRWRWSGRLELRTIYRSIFLRGSSRLFPVLRYTDPGNVGFDWTTTSDFHPCVRAVPRTQGCSFPRPSTSSRTLAVKRWSGRETKRRESLSSSYLFEIFQRDTFFEIEYQNRWFLEHDEFDNSVLVEGGWCKGLENCEAISNKYGSRSKVLYSKMVEWRQSWRGRYCGAWLNFFNFVFREWIAYYQCNLNTFSRVKVCRFFFFFFLETRSNIRS